MTTKFQKVCIGGGCIRGLCELGALHYFYNEGLLDVHTFVGTSIGAAISLLLCVGYTPMDIFIQASKIESWMDFEVMDFLNFKDDGGLFDIKNFIKHIETMVKRKLHYIPTLKELYELTHKHLIIVTTNVTKRQSEYIDYQDFPNLSCIDAIQMSCSIPIIFKRFEYNDCYYVDGAMLDNFPIQYINDDKTKILGICVDGYNKDNPSFLNYVYTLITLPVLEIQRIKIKNLSKNCFVVNVVVNDTPPIDFTLAKDTKMDMFCKGYKYAEEYCIENFISDWKWDAEEK